MKHEGTRELFAYWNKLRGERTAPERSDIDPAAIRNILADTFMLDVDLAQRFPFRLAGTRVNGLFDGEQKGRSFVDLWRAEERRNITAVLLTVADGACPVVVGGKAAPGGRAPCGFELLFLPLRHFGKTHARILGIVTPKAQAPWLGLLPLEPLELKSLRIVEDARAALAWRPNRIAVGASLFGNRSIGVDADECLLTDEGMVRNKPRLRLIEGGRTQD